MQKAPLGKRFAALVIDSLIIGVATYLISIIFFEYIYVISFLISMIYSSLMEGSQEHATLGKRLMKLKVSFVSGNGSDMQKASIRNLIKYGPTLLNIFLPPYVAGVFGIINYSVGAFGSNKQALHDMAVCSFVVSAEGQSVPIIVPTPAPSYSSYFVRGINGMYANARFQLTSPIVFGRDQAACNIIFPAETPGVSGRHCELAVLDGKVLITDLSSSYGTFVSGTRLDSGRAAVLRNGESFTVGSNTFTVDVI